MFGLPICSVMLCAVYPIKTFIITIACVHVAGGIYNKGSSSTVAVPVLPLHSRSDLCARDLELGCKIPPAMQATIRGTCIYCSIFLLRGTVVVSM